MIADRIRSIQAVSGGGGGGFDPSQLSGLKLWLKADTGVTVDGSGNVSSWADQSGNNNTAYQTDPTKYPVFSAAYSVNGVPAVFGQNNQALLLTTPIGGTLGLRPLTVVWVGTKKDTVTGPTAIEAYGSNGGFGFFANSATFYAFLPNVGSINYGVSNGLTQPSAHYAGVGFPDFTMESTHGSKITRTTYSASNYTVKSLFVGDYVTTNPGYAINEIMIFDRSISDAEMAEIKAYIKTRYNLYSTLPVSGAALWLDGADSSTIFKDAGVTPVSVAGDLIYQWSDKSGNNRHATQATSGNRPTWVPPASGQNGFGAVQTNASSQWMSGTIQNYSAKTMIVVTKYLSTSGGGRIFVESDEFTQDNQSGGYAALFITTGSYVTSSNGATSGNAALVNYLVNDSKYHRLMHLNNNGSITNYVDASSATASFSVSKIMTKYWLGVVPNASVGRYGGIYCEVIHYPFVLDSSQIASIDSYIKSKWGMTY